MRRSGGVISGDMLLKVPNDRFRVRQRVSTAVTPPRGEDQVAIADRLDAIKPSLKRQQVALPTAHSDAELRDLADAATNDPVIATMIAEAVPACLESERAEVLVVALLQSAIGSGAGTWSTNIRG